MGNPEAPKALDISDGLDTEHRGLAARLGAETFARIQESFGQARKRREEQIGGKALQTFESETPVVV